MKNNMMLIAAAITFAVSANAQNNNVYFKQYQRSIQGITANFLPNGAVIASPSRRDPDYYYDWVRDTALTMKAMISLEADSRISAVWKNDVKRRIDTWIDWELARQQVHKLTDQGEPRFHVDGRTNTDPWGRPQNDGPALRSLAAIELANQWIKQGRMNEVTARLYKGELPARTLIKRDLEYIAHHWTESSFDLWEEERAMHYYTMVAQYVALTKGAELARKLNDGDGATFYLKQANSIQQALNAFIDRKTGTIKYAVNKVSPLPHKQSDLDIAVLLIAIQTFDGKFYVPVNELVRTANALSTVFQNLYKINQQTRATNGANLGIALGRYPDDRYSGFDFSQGNPWFLATLALAEFACDLSKTGYAPNARDQLRQTAIGQFNRVLYHFGQGGTMSEQFNQNTGIMQGARDLTWSYTSYITAYRACFNGTL